MKNPITTILSKLRSHKEQQVKDQLAALTPPLGQANDKTPSFEGWLPDLIRTYTPAFTPKQCTLPVQERERLVLRGICIGDMAGSRIEGWGLPSEDTPESYPIFYSKGNKEWPRKPTDDTVMSCAIHDATAEIREEKEKYKLEDIPSVYAKEMRAYAKRYPDAGYGYHFYQWAIDDMENENYRSCGDGGAMRAGIIGSMFDDVSDVITQAAASSYPTHSHPEGMKGSILVAVCVWMALHGASKDEICSYVYHLYPGGFKDYAGIETEEWMDPTITISELQALSPYSASVLTQVSVPEAVVNYRESSSYESCIRNAFRYRCDADTIGAISGGIAAAYYKNTDIEGFDSEKVVSEITGDLHPLLRLS